MSKENSRLKSKEELREPSRKQSQSSSPSSPSPSNVSDDASTISDASDPDAVPRAIIEKGFIIESTHIAEGGFSKLYKAKWNQMPDKQLVCKKTVLDAVDPVWREKCLKTEMKVSKKLKHPNVVRVYDIMKTRRFAFIFMDYCKNGNMYDRLMKDKKPFSEKQSKKWFNQLLSALYYIHSIGIAHRDIKLENFLLDDVLNALLSDFGFACFDKDVKSINDPLMKGTTCGTIEYMAPEVQSPPYDAKVADVYSMGVCLFEMLNSQKPFNPDVCSNPKKLVECQKQRKYKYRVTNLSMKAKNLVDELLEPSPQARITSEKALMHAWFKG